MKTTAMMMTILMLIPFTCFGQESDPFGADEKAPQATVNPFENHDPDDPFGSAKSGTKASDPFARERHAKKAAGSFFASGRPGGNPFGSDRALRLEKFDQAQMMARINDLQVQRAQLQQRLGSKHPQLKALDQQVTFLTDYIRAQKDQNPFSDSNYAAIAGLTKKLKAEVEKLRPLRQNETSLDNAIAELNKALAVLKAEKNLRSDSNQEMENRRRLLELQNAAKGFMEVEEKNRQDVERHMMQLSLKNYQEMIHERDDRLESMKRQIEAAQNAAKKAKIREADAAVLAQHLADKVKAEAAMASRVMDDLESMNIVAEQAKADASKAKMDAERAKVGAERARAEAEVNQKAAEAEEKRARATQEKEEFELRLRNMEKKMQEMAEMLKKALEEKS